MRHSIAAGRLLLRCTGEEGIRALTDDELVVLVGMVRLVLHADEQITPAEQDALAALQRAFGAERWNAAVRAGRSRYAASEALIAEARRVRTSVRRRIYGILTDLARSDDVVSTEIEVLRWVAAEWGLTDPG